MAWPDVTPIVTARVLVRAVLPSDLDALFEVNSDPQTTQFLPYDAWKTRADGEAWLARIEAQMATGLTRQCVVVRRGDEKVIGAIVLFRFDLSSARFELGYVLGRAVWRQGYAREALAAVCSSAFRDLGIRRIEAEVSPDNLASNALLLSLGFTVEGRLRERWVAKGAAYDTLLYGCLAREWPAQ